MTTSFAENDSLPFGPGSVSHRSTEEINKSLDDFEKNMIRNSVDFKKGDDESSTENNNEIIDENNNNNNNDNNNENNNNTENNNTENNTENNNEDSSSTESDSFMGKHVASGIETFVGDHLDPILENVQMKKGIIKFIPFGGLGNQFISFSFCYLLSAIYRMKLLIADDTVFYNCFTVREAFPGHISYYTRNKYTWPKKMFTKPYKSNREANLYLGWLGDKDKRFNQRIIHGTMDDYIQSRTLIISGWENYLHLFYEIPRNQILLKELGCDITLVNTTFINPPKQYRYLTDVLSISLRKKQILEDYMISLLPNYAKSNYLSAHIRTGGQLADFKDKWAFLNMKDIVPMIKFIKQHTKENHYSYAYVATDSTEVKHLIHTLCGSTCKYSKAKEIKTTDGAQKNDRSTFVSIQLYALSEMMLVGSSQECIGTWPSSYSWIACSFINRESLFIVRSDFKNDTLPKFFN
ncbi:hypothetical protein WA158_004857 [Blastocystis sp. Blastoise]